MRKIFYGLGILTAVAIAANWDADELWNRASPHLRTMMKQADLHGLFDAAKGALGPLLDYRGSKGEALISVMNAQTTVSAKYVASGHFQKGDAQLQIVLVKQGDAWMIEGFHINSPALMQRLVGVRS